MKKYLPLAALLLIAAAALGLLLHSLAGEAIRAALVQAYRAVHAVASGIPQPIYWAILLLVILLSAVRSILGDTGGRARVEPEAAGGRTAEWRDRLQRAARPGNYQDYYRWQVARNLARLAGEVVAQQLAITPGEAERQIEDGDVALPPEVRDYVLAGLRPRPIRSSSWRTRLAAPPPRNPLDLDPEQAVEAIESLMEVSHGNHRP